MVVRARNAKMGKSLRARQATERIIIKMTFISDLNLTNPPNFSIK